MLISIDQRTGDATSYRAARVKSLFNCEDGSRFTLAADLDIDDPGWKVGVVVGPSGSGKTSIGRSLWGGGVLLRAGRLAGRQADRGRHRPGRRLQRRDSRARSSRPR